MSLFISLSVFMHTQLPTQTHAQRIIFINKAPKIVCVYCFNMVIECPSRIEKIEKVKRLHFQNTNVQITISQWGKIMGNSSNFQTVNNC